MYDAIHSLDVIHGDVRAENILIHKDGKTVWIVDFEFSESISEDIDMDSKIGEENQVVRHLLLKIKQKSESNGHYSNGL
jgi:tRNA A-37 threonylcarbamoyl transferase component Bud32